MEYKNISEKQIAKKKEAKLEFEDFVDSLFKSEKFKTKALKREIAQSQHISSSHQSYPDFLVRYSDGSKSTMFAVKCKWNPKLIQTHSWKSPAKIQKLLLFEQETKTPLFVVLGFGGSPSAPEFVYLARLEKLKECMVKLSYLFNFKRQVTDKEFDFDLERMILK